MKRNTMRAWLVTRRGYRAQETIAALAGISQNYYSCLENGVRQPSVETAQRLGAVLGVPWTWFFEPPNVETADRSRSLRSAVPPHGSVAE